MNRIRFCSLFLLLFGLSLPAQTRGTSSKEQLVLSPLFSRLAFGLTQDLSRLSSASTKLIDENDLFSSPYDIQKDAIEEHLARIEAFDLRTAGDRKLFSMLRSAMLFINHGRLISSYGQWLTFYRDKQLTAHV